MIVARTSLHVVAQDSGYPRAQFNSLRPMDSADNASRPSDAYGTFRVLIEEGQSDPMTKTSCFPFVTVLHMYTEPVEVFKCRLK